MISLLIVDSSAESRRRIVDEINACLLIDPSHLHFLPRVSLKPICPEEIPFTAIPDICVVGPHLLLKDLNELGRIRRQFPKTALLVRGNGTLESISVIEHLARLGADDILPQGLTPIELLRKLVLHARSSARTRSGTLITVDSGKGGLGVTSIAACFAESAVELGKKTVLIDLDIETQDLCRFLQVRPFINENLSSLLDQQKPMVQELVEECVYQVWGDETKLFAVPPAAGCDAFDDPRSSIYRTFVSFFEILDSLFDVIIVDRGCAKGVLRKTLHRISDHILLVHGNDPASMYATAETIKNAYASMTPTSHLWLVQNAPSKHGIPCSLMREEMKRATRLQQECFLQATLPFSSSGTAWPGSGGTLLSQSGRRFRKAFHAAVAETNLFPFPSDGKRTTGGTLSAFFHRLLDRKGPRTTRSPEALPKPENEADSRPSIATAAIPEIRGLPEPAAPSDCVNKVRRTSRELIGKAQVMQ